MSALSVSPGFVFAATLRSTVSSWLSVAAAAGKTIAAHNAIQAKAARVNAARTRAKRTGSPRQSVLTLFMESPPLDCPLRQSPSRASVGRLSQAVNPCRWLQPLDFPCRAAFWAGPLVFQCRGESPVFSYVRNNPYDETAAEFICPPPCAIRSYSTPDSSGSSTHSV